MYHNVSAGKWDKGRFDQIVNGLTPFLKGCGYNMKKEVTFLPVAALYGHNIKERVPKEMCDWCETGSMFEVRARLTRVESSQGTPLMGIRPWHS
jgi:peptide chain release factor subunit 3